MKMVRIISLIARVALMATMVLGLLFWLAQLPSFYMLLSILNQIGYTSIHESLGFLGVFGLLVLAALAIFTRGIRRLGMGSVIYACVLPALGLAQALILVDNLHWLIQVVHLLVGIGAMFLLRRIEKRYQRLKLKESAVASVRSQPQETF